VICNGRIATKGRSHKDRFLFGAGAGFCGSELARDCGGDRSQPPAPAASRPRPLPQGLCPIRSRDPGSVGGVFWTRQRRRSATAASRL